jgi:hypothetical protein
MANIKSEAEKQALSNISNYVATKTVGAIASGHGDNFAVKSPLDLPPLIGNQRYWVRLTNSSSYAWVEVGFGNTPAESDLRAFIPSTAQLSGAYVSGSGPAFVEYVSNSSGLYVTLIGGN